jgi:hypothetical protein
MRIAPNFAAVRGGPKPRNAGPMGNSDSAYFAWMTSVLHRYNQATGGIVQCQATDLLVLGGARMNPAIDWICQATGRPVVTYWDLYDEDALLPVDFNELTAVPSAICDVLMLTRASYLISDLGIFCSHARRLLRPGGLLIMDWVYGSAEAPVRGVRGAHQYGDDTKEFVTTYDAGQVGLSFTVEWGEAVNLARETGQHYTYFLTILRPRG